MTKRERERSPIALEFGKRLQLLRKKRGLTQEEVAERLTVAGFDASKGRISNWEKGTRLPALKDNNIFSVLSNILGVSVEEVAPKYDAEIFVYPAVASCSLPLIQEETQMSLQAEIIRAESARSFFISTEEHPANSYAVRAQDHANYPEIIGPGDGYLGDIIVFQRASDIEPENGDLVHIEVRTKSRKIRTIRAYSVEKDGSIRLKAASKRHADYEYPHNGEIQILGVFLELRRTGRRCL